MISIRMIKIPLSMIFNDSLNEGKLHSEWKESSIVPVHNKEDKLCEKLQTHFLNAHLQQSF